MVNNDVGAHMVVVLAIEVMSYLVVGLFDYLLGLLCI